MDTHWRLLENEEQWDHDSYWDELETDGDSPCHVALWIHEGHTVVDPETESDSNDDDDLEETGDSTSDPLGGNLTSIGWADYGNDQSITSQDSDSARFLTDTHETDTETSSESATVNRRDTGGSDDLHDGTDNEDPGTDHKRPFTTKLVLQLTAEDGTEESSSLEDGDDVSLNVCDECWTFGLIDSEVPLERF